MILKSRLRVTQRHQKWNRWIDHPRLTVSRVIWSWILSWPWNLVYRSLKIICESLGEVSYSRSVVTMAISVVVCDLENRVRVRSRWLEMVPFDRQHPISY